MSGITNLKLLRDEIEKMDSIHQIHIFKILKENQIDFTENSNGVFINMTLLDDSTLKQINNFIKYVNLQQKQLDINNIILCFLNNAIHLRIIIRIT